MSYASERSDDTNYVMPAERELFGSGEAEPCGGSLSVRLTDWSLPSLAYLCSARASARARARARACP